MLNCMRNARVISSFSTSHSAFSISADPPLTPTLSPEYGGEGVKTLAHTMKIYTKTGDDGSTGLIGGARISKADPRLECYGTVDELNAAIGVAIAGAAGESRIADVVGRLHAVQAELFVIGSH